MKKDKAIVTISIFVIAIPFAAFSAASLFWQTSWQVIAIGAVLGVLSIFWTLILYFARKIKIW